MPTRLRQHASTLIAGFTICVFALLLMWPALLRGGVFLPLDALLHLQPWRYSYERVAVNNQVYTDPIRQIYPRLALTNAIINQGEWPLWNPTILTGTPLLADGQIALFYPPSLLFRLLPLARAFGWYAFVQLALAGLGAYAFARRIRLGQGAAILAASTYMFNGFFLTWLAFPELSGGNAVLPWCFWAVERAIQRRSWASWALAGAALALPLITQLQLAFYCFVALGAYLVWRGALAPGWRARAQIACGFGAALALALALSAVQLLPAFELSGQGQRSDIGSTVGSPEGYVVSVLRLVFPMIGGFARVGPPPVWGPAPLQVLYPYVGIAPLLLAMLALWFSRHPLSMFFGLLAVGSFALAVASPLLEVFLLLVPPYRQFQDHTRWFLLWSFATAQLAGMAAHELRLRARSASVKPSLVRVVNRVLFGGIALALAAALLVHLGLFTPESRYGQYITLVRSQPLLPPALALLAGAAATWLLTWRRRLPYALRWGPLLAVIVVDLLWTGGNFNTTVVGDIAKPTTDLTRALAALGADQQQEPTLYPPTRQMAFLQRQQPPFRIFGADYFVLPPNIASTFGLEDIRGYHSLYIGRYNRLARLIDGKDFTQTSAGITSLRMYFTSAYRYRNLLDMLNVRYLLFAPGEGTDPKLYAPLELVYDSDEGRIYRNPQALPRAWLVHRAEVIADDDHQLARMVQPDFDPAALAVLASPAPELVPASGPEPEPTSSYAPNRTTVHATTSAAALLMLSDAYYDGWQATVDGKPTTIYRANYAFRAVWLAPGEHTVEFRYRPMSFAIGGVLSLAALLALCGWAGWSCRQSIQRSRLNQASNRSGGSRLVSKFDDR